MYLLVVRLVERLHYRLGLRRHLQRLGASRGGGRRGRVLQRRRGVVHAHRDVGQRDGLGLDVARRLKRGENVKWTCGTSGSIGLYRDGFSL